MSTDTATQIAMCTFCPKLCRHVCPVSNAEPRETLIPQAKVSLLGRLRSGETERTEAQQAALYGCTGCGACTEFCRHKVEVGPLLYKGRAEAMRDGVASPALANIEAKQLERSRQAANTIKQQVPQRRRPVEAQVAFLPGCRAPELGKTMLEIADRVGADYLSIADGEHSCGGAELLAAGADEAFRRHAGRMANQLRGYAKVVVHCAECAVAMKTQYPLYGAPLSCEIEHTTQFLETFASRLPVHELAEPAFYQDSCHLARHLDVTDAPRTLLQKTVKEIYEYSRNRRDAVCCGGSGLLPVTMPDTAHAIAVERGREPKEAGIPRVITGCATCKHQLAQGGVEALDILDVIHRATTPQTPSTPAPKLAPKLAKRNEP